MRKLLLFLEKPSIKQGSLVLLDQGFVSIATFVTGVTLARAASKEEYGSFVLGVSLILFMQGLHSALVNVPFTVYAPHLSENNRKIYQGSALVHTLILCALVVTGMLVVYKWNESSAAPRSNELYALLPWLATVASAFFLRGFIRNSLLARLQIRSGLVINMLCSALQLVLVMWLFSANLLTVRRAFELAAAISLLAAMSMFWSHRDQLQVVRSHLWPDLLRAMKTGKWVLIDVFAYMGASLAYPWLVLYFANPQAVAGFGVCNAIAGLPGPYLRGVSAYIHPRMVHAYKGTNITKLVRMLRLSFVVLAIPYIAWLLIGSLFAEQIVVLFYGSSYSGYAALTTLLLIKAAIEALSSPLSNALQTVERADVVTMGLAIATTVTLALGPILILRIGVDGAGIAGVASAAANALWKWVRLRKVASQLAEYRVQQRL